LLEVPRGIGEAPLIRHAQLLMNIGASMHLKQRGLVRHAIDTDTGHADFPALPVFYGITSEGLTETRLRLQFGKAHAMLLRKPIAKGCAPNSALSAVRSSRPARRM
jgi:hypothetical protein